MDKRKMKKLLILNLPYSFHHLLAADFVKCKAAMCQESLTHHCFGKI